MTRKRKWLLIAISSLLLAVAAHGFVLFEWTQGRYIVGPNDGLSQMIPFKHFLYEAMRNGNFFYSEKFGLGGGTFSQLGYYFSTSLVFLATAGLTFLLEVTGIIAKPTLQYWADVTVFVSIFRLTGILLLTTYFFRQIGFRMAPAFIAATVYGTSILYFRHVTYWEFFADAQLFFPLLLIGVERLIRQGKIAWFIIAVAVNMMDNFYFAYINFLITGIYIVCRWFIPIAKEEIHKVTQIGLLLKSGVLGALISLPLFVSAVYGYLNNSRPPYEGEIPIFEIVDNILTGGRIIVLPAVAMVFLFLFSLYHHQQFRLFACLTVATIIMHVSPLVGSLFNGFSAPQYRWEHLLMLAVAGLIAAALTYWREVRLPHVLIGVLITAGLSFYTYRMDRPSLYTNGLLFIALLSCLGIIYLAWKKQKETSIYILKISIVLFTIGTANLFQVGKLTSNQPTVDQVAGKGIPQSFLQSSKYNDPKAKDIIEGLTAHEKDPLARFEWMIGVRNNTPIVQGFLGMSIYSSILNQHLLHFYLEDLSIDMGRESVSRYHGLGNRLNLYALLNGAYVLRPSAGQDIPFDFQEVAKKGEIVAYENQHRLPFVRLVHQVYTEEAMEDAPVLAREHAMLKGVILEDWPQASLPPPPVENLLDHFTIEAVDAIYTNDELKVTEKEGGLDLIVSDRTLLKEDTYLSFVLERKSADRGYPLLVNDFETSRKRADSIYRTHVDRLTIRVPSEERIRIRLPKGVYSFEDLMIHAEDYLVLKEAEVASAETATALVDWQGGKVSIDLENKDGQPFVVMPIPFEKGWTAKVNGKKQPILKANYAFTGLPVEKGKNVITMTYHPPFFFESLGLSLFGLLASFYLVNKRKKRVPI